MDFLINFIQFDSGTNIKHEKSSGVFCPIERPEPTEPQFSVRSDQNQRL